MRTRLGRVATAKHMSIWDMSTMKNKQEILEAFRKNPDMMAILTIIRNLELTDSWLAAGSVRNFIWNLLSDRPAFDLETDVDVIFFDPDISYEETLSLEKKLREDFPQYQWELKNQSICTSIALILLPIAALVML